MNIEIDMIDAMCFQEMSSTYLALLNYYQKQEVILEYSDTVVMEADTKKSFKSKLKNLWKGFLALLKRFCETISRLFNKIKKSKMAKNLKRKFSQLKQNIERIPEYYRRKKYNTPAREVSLRNPNPKNKTQLTREEILKKIDFENQTIDTFIFDYDRILGRVLIQEETLESIIEVLEKYMSDDKFSLSDALRELEVGSKASSKRGDAMKYYDFSNGFYNDINIDKDVFFREGGTISWDDYCRKFETLESKMPKLNELADACATRIETIMRSSKFKDDFVLGNGDGVDADEPWRSFHWTDTQHRYYHAVDPKFKKGGNDKPLAGGDDYDNLYYLQRISAHLSYSMNYMVSLYQNMKAEYDTIMSIKLDTGEGDT